MTTIRSDAADRFVSRPPPDMRCFLVHGVDEGLIHERAKALVGAVLGPDFGPLDLSRFDGDQLAREPGRIADEAYAVSMFGGRRAIWIDAGSRDLTAQVEPLLHRPPQETWLVFEAGNLKKTSPLRALFEQAGNAASIECYRDDRKSIYGLIDAEAAAFGLAISADAREQLATLLGSDRQTTRGELTKLMLYALGGDRVELRDVEAIVADAAPSSVDSLIDQSLRGNLAGAETLAGSYFRDGGDAAFLLIRLVSRVFLLHQLGLDRGRGMGGPAQGQMQRLPLTERAALAKQSENWDAAAVGKRLTAILAVVARARREPRLEEAITSKALWAIASDARARRN